MLLEGLPADASFITAMQVEWEERDAWRRALAEQTGRDYTRPTRRVSLEDFAAAQGVG